MSTEKPQTAEQARVRIREIIRALPEAERGRLICYAGIADRPDTAEDAMGFFKQMVATLTSDELSELNVEFRSGLEGQEERIFVVSEPGDADYTIIQDELGNDTFVFLTVDMWKGLLTCMNDLNKQRKLAEKQRTKDWAFLNNIINQFAEQSKDVYQRRLKLTKCSDVKKDRTASRHALIDQHRAASIAAGTDPDDAQAIFKFVKDQDETLLRKSKKTTDLIDPQNMMLVYWRSKRGKNNCNRSE